MPSISHASLHALDTPGRFAEGALIVDCRYQHFASLTPAVIAPLFVGRYVHAAGLGSQACTNGEGDAAPQLIAWQEGLAQVQAVHTPGQPVIVLCGCLEVDARSHRALVGRELAHALGLVDGGALP